MNYYQPARYSYSCYSMLSFGRNESNIVYNYLYISKLYVFSENQRPSEINCHNCNCNKPSLTFTHSRFLYQATESHTKFVIDSERKSLQVEVPVNLRQLLEVQPEASVITSGDRNVAAVEHVRVALGSLLGHSLGEREVRVAAEELICDALRVEPKYALIFLTDHHTHVAAQDCFYVTA